MRKHEFTQAELSEVAFNVYSREDGIKYVVDNDIYYIEDCGDYTEIGNLEKVNNYFESQAPWYAFERDYEDNDWGTGTFDKKEAMIWLFKAKKDYPDAHIAVIINDYCDEEIWEAENE